MATGRQIERIGDPVLDRAVRRLDSRADEALIPVGAAYQWFGPVKNPKGVPTIPAGYLACMGQTLKVSDYPALYNVIGNRFGGTPNSTFKLPDTVNIAVYIVRAV